MVVAHKSTSEELGILRKVFEKYDKDRNGSIQLDEFKAALESYGYTDDEVQRMFTGLVCCSLESLQAFYSVISLISSLSPQDVDQTGEIKYIEFLAATIEAQGAISEERLAEAFDRYARRCSSLNRFSFFSDDKD